MEQAYHITEVPDVGVPMRVVPYNEPVEPPAPPTPLPDWLSLTPKPEEQTRLVKFPRSKAELEYEQSVFEAIFEPILDEMVIGNGIIDYLKADPRNVDEGRFRRWIDADKIRRERFEKAQEIATEAILERMDKIAAGTDSMEDIERSKLRLRQLEFKIRAWNKRRYGQDKDVPAPFGSGGITINISAVESPYVGNTIEHTP